MGDEPHISSESDIVGLPETYPKALIIGGGSIRGIAVLGVFYRLNRYFKNIETIYGNSIGSVLGFLMCLGISPLKTFTFCLMETIDTFNIASISWLDGKLRWGLWDISSWKNKLINFIKSEGKNPSLTFMELYKQSGVRLVVPAGNITEFIGVYFSPETHPNDEVLEICMLSSNLPGVFTERMYNGDFYVDGFTVADFPIKEALKKYNRSDIIGIRMTDISKGEICGVGEYFHRSYALASHNSTFDPTLYSDVCIILIDCKGTANRFNMNTTRLQKYELFGRGVSSADKFLLDTELEIFPTSED